jgi:hypothetical protein
LLLAGGGIALLMNRSTHPGLRKLSRDCIGCHNPVSYMLVGTNAGKFSKGVHPVAPGFIPSEPSIPDTRVMTGEECSMCHAEVFRTWKQANHARAFSNAIFQTAFKLEKTAWCVNCHGPLWQRDRTPLEKLGVEGKDEPGLHHAGVSCVVCHMKDGQIYTRNAKKRDESKLFHPLYVDTRLGDEEYCGGCHQFNFVSHHEPWPVYENSVPMQNTVAEYRESVPDRRVACYSCHFEKTDHSLHPKGDLKSVFKYKIASSRHDERRRITFDIRLENLGHYFPTGDLLRILSLYVKDSKGEELFRKDYRKQVRIIDRSLVADTVLKPDRATLTATDRVIFETKTRDLRCEIVYRRQGGLEHKASKFTLPEKIHHNVLYAGPCDVAKW